MTDSKPLPTRPLGKNGPQLPRLGLGLMNNSGMYNLAGSDESRFAFLDAAHKNGEIFWDTGKSAASPLSSIA
jgi:aryl-alcohol dehydrogenase-like predicted oxidoreductase